MQIILFSFILFAGFISFSPKQDIAPHEIEPIKITEIYLEDNNNQEGNEYWKLVLDHAGNDMEFASLTLAVIKAESDFNFEAGSNKGAVGLMQLMPSTASEVSKQLGVHFEEKDLLDPYINVKLGTEYMRYIQGRLEGIEDEERKLILTLASYNSGLHRVKRSFECNGFECYIQRANLCNEAQFNNAMNNLPEETRNYLKNVMDHYAKYKKFFNVV